MTEQIQNPHAIELSSILDPESNTDKKILKALKKYGASTVSDLQILLQDCMYVSPHERVSYPISGLGDASFKRLEQVTSPLGVDIYPSTQLDPKTKKFIGIAQGFVPAEKYYDFRRAIEAAYLGGNEK